MIKLLALFLFLPSLVFAGQGMGPGPGMPASASGGGGTLVGDDTAYGSVTLDYSLDRHFGRTFTSVATGTATSICVRPNSTTDIKLAVYDASDNLLTSVTISATNQSGSKQCGTISQAITNSTSYKLGFGCSVDACTLYNQPTGSAFYDSEAYSTQPPDPIANISETTFSREFAIWLE